MSADPLAPYRKRLLGIAYRMLGSRVDAEDMLQEAYLRLTRASGIRNVEAFLVTTVTRLCLDYLKSARARKEVYVGPWLPEPVLDADMFSPEDASELASDLSFALLLALERLKAAERAAFLLHDVFDIPFSEIARTLGKTEAACRQLASRARKVVREARPAMAPSPEAHARLLFAFLDAAARGDTDGLKALLRAEVVATTDGGGVRQAALRPIVGAENVARFFIGLVRKNAERIGDFRIVLCSINGAPGLVAFIDGVLDQTLTVDVVDDKIAAVYVVRNPKKLGAIAGVEGSGSSILEQM